MKTETIGNELAKAREEIDSIDGALVQILDRRLDMALAIGKFKQKNKLPIFNEAREKQVLAKAQFARNSAAVEQILRAILNVSKLIQAKTSLEAKI